MSTIASLLVKIGADDTPIQKALASVGERTRSLDADLKKLGNSPLAPGAQKSLESLKATMDTITTAQQRVAERATFAAQGIEAIGGAGRLTDTQLKAMNRTLQDGLSSFKALGQDAPKQLQDVANAVKSNLEPALSAVDKKMIAIGSAIGTFLGNAALQAGQSLIQAGKDAFDYADQLENLKAATDLSVDGLQKLEALGAPAKVSMQDLAGSVEQLQKHLDDPAAVKAIQDMGKNYAYIRSLKPEDQFLDIAKGVAAIEDPVARANAGTALFGKTWFTIAPAIVGNIDQVINSATRLSKEEVEALDKAGDAWDLWKLRASRNIDAVLGRWVIAAQRFNDEGVGTARGLAPAFKDGQLPALPGAPRLFSSTPLATLAAPDDVGSPVLFGKTLEQQKEATIALEKFKALQDQLFGRATIDHVQELTRALGGPENVTKLTADATKKLHDQIGEALEVYRALGREVPVQLQQIFDKTKAIQTITGRTIGNGLGTAPGSVLSPGSGLFNIPGVANSVKAGPGKVSGTSLPSPATFANDLFASVPGAIQAAIQGGGSKLEAAGSAIGSTIFGQNSSLTKTIAGFAGKIPGVVGQALGSAVPVIGSLIGPAIEGLTKLWGKAFGTAGRDAVRDFASAAGGFEPLHKQLESLGEDGETLWKNLTQGVGRNNSEQAKAAIEKVTKALDAQKQKILDQQVPLQAVTARLSAITILTPELKDKLDAAFNSKTPNAYKLALEGINTELDKQKGHFDDVQTALDKYGLSFTTAGKEFKQQRINLDANGLITDFNTLKEAGVDITTEIKGMGGALSTFAQNAKDAGVEVPDAMKPILQAAIDAGVLFDKDGKPIKDLSALGLSFGTTMETVMKKTIPEAIDRLTIVLEGLAKFLGIDLPSAAKTGADKTQDELDGIKPPDLTVHVKTQFDPSNSPDYNGNGDNGDGSGYPGYKTGSGGVRDFGAGTLAVLHGREAVIPEADLVAMNRAAQAQVSGSASAALGTPQTIQVINHFHGSILAATEYVEQHVVKPILTGIARYHRAEFGRLVASTS